MIIKPTLNFGHSSEITDILRKPFFIEDDQIQDTGVLLEAHAGLHVDQELVLSRQIPDLESVLVSKYVSLPEKITEKGLFYLLINYF